MLHKRRSTVGLCNLAFINHPITLPRTRRQTINSNMSFIPNTENQRRRYSSRSMPPRGANQTASTPAQTYPLLAPSPGASNMGLSRNWPQQSGGYPYVIPEIGQSDYGNTRSMGSLAPNYSSQGTAPLSSTNNPPVINSPYVTPYPDSWNITYAPVAPMSTDQPSWEQSNMGFNGYQQHSPSRSDGSASTQVSSLSSPYTNPSPLIKLEQQPELSPYGGRYAFENASHQQANPMSTGAAPMILPRLHRPFTTSTVSYGRPTDEVKCDFDSYDMESLSISSDPRMRPEGQSKRGYTTPEEATCTCEICGKDFNRSNNLKNHMQTHAPNRSKPHKCEYGDCPCAFTRKTDLVRHEQSVSLCSSSSFEGSLLTGIRCT